MTQVRQRQAQQIFEARVAHYQMYPAYRDSEIEWLGEIPAHWELTRLKHTVTACQNGIWGDEPEDEQNAIICIRVADFDRVKLRVTDEDLTRRQIPKNQLRERLLEHGDLLLEKSGGGEFQPVGAVILFDLDTDAVSSNFIARMPVAAGYDPAFLAYVHFVIYDRRINIKSIKQTTGIQNLDSYQYLMEIAAFPDFTEQRAIATFLDHQTAKIDALIAKKRELIAVLHEKRSATISHAVTKGLNPDAPMKDSGIEWVDGIPAHWQVNRLKFVADVRGGVAKGRKFEGVKTVELPYLRVANVQAGHLDLSDMAEIEVTVSEIERYSLKVGDVLMNEGGDYDKLGRGAVWQGQIEPCLHQNHVFAVRPYQHCLSDWITTLTLAQYARFYFMINSKQSTNLASISSRNLSEFPVILPPQGERQQILKYIENETRHVDSLIAKTEETIERLQEYRATLISAAVTGKIDVRDL